jgi:hypothetical protein
MCASLRAAVCELAGRAGTRLNLSSTAPGPPSGTSWSSRSTAWPWAGLSPSPWPGRTVEACSLSATRRGRSTPGPWSSGGARRPRLLHRPPGEAPRSKGRAGEAALAGRKVLDRQIGRLPLQVGPKMPARTGGHELSRVRGTRHGRGARSRAAVVPGTA